MTEIQKQFEKFVDNYIDEEFSNRENTAGVFKSARKAELMLKLDTIMEQFIEELIQSKF